MLNSYRQHFLICTALLGLSACGFACSDNPTHPGGSFAAGPYSWATIDTFEAGGRLDAIAVASPGDVFCALRGLDRYGDGWTIYPEGSVVRYDGSTWSPSLYEIHASSWDLDMWAASATDVYLADGTLRHFDGSSWSDLNVPANVVYGVGPSDVYAASTADSKAVRHYDGTAWTLLTQLTGDDDIESIWAMAGPFVVVARTHGVSTWDGTTWTEAQFRSYDDVDDVWGTGPDNVFVVGNPYSSHGQVMHFDGLSWTYPTIPEIPQLHSIWGSGPSDVYSVGEDGAILHFDGTLWSEVERVTCKALREVSGSGPSDVYAVGDDGKALHFDGTLWKSIRKDNPDHHVGTIWAESFDRFAMNGLDCGTVYLYDRGAWRETYVGIAGGVRTLAGRSLDDLYALVDREVYHFDGETWKFSGSLDAFFPGEMWFPDEPYAGFAIGGGSIFQFNGSSWREVVKDAPWVMVSLWGAARDCVYVINSTGIVYHYDGTSWNTIPAPADALIDMWGVSATEVYVLAEKLYRYDGTSWQALAATPPYGSALVMNASTNMFSWGGCWLSHFDGGRWKTECSPHEPPSEIVESRDGSILMLTQRAVYHQVPFKLFASE